MLPVVEPVHLPLNLLIQQKTENRFFLKRLVTSLKEIGKQHPLKGVCATIATIFTTIYGISFSAFCVEGAVRSFWDVHDSGSLITRELGDAGGWTALAIFATLAVGTLGMQLIREGEYLKIKRICAKWIHNHPGPHEKIYKKMTEMLREYNAVCFFGKNVITRQLFVIELFKDYRGKQSKKQIVDLSLHSHYQNVHDRIKEETSTKKIINRLREGNRASKNRSCTRQFGAFVLGVALPIILFSSAILSFIGEVLLGLEVWKDRHDTTAVGHLGEWPLNGAEAIGAGLLFFYMCFLNEGDFVISQKILKEELVKLEKQGRDIESSPKNREERHFHKNQLKRFRKIANEELARQASGCQFAKTTYKFIEKNPY